MERGGCYPPIEQAHHIHTLPKSPYAKVHRGPAWPGIAILSATLLAQHRGLGLSRQSVIRHGTSFRLGRFERTETDKYRNVCGEVECILDLLRQPDRHLVVT